MPPATSQSSSPHTLVFGDEDHDVKERAKGICGEWIKAMPEHEQEIIDASSGNASEACRAISSLREALDTMPLFGTGKCIWFRGCNFLGEERTSLVNDVVEGLAKVINTLGQVDSARVRLIISAGKVDKRKSFYKKFQKLGEVVFLSSWDASKSDWIPEAERRIAAYFRENAAAIEPEAIACLIENVGPHPRQLLQESEKVLLYCSDKAQATEKDVQQVVSRNKQAKAFALGDALGNRDLPLAMARLDEELWEMKLNPKRNAIGLLYGLISKIRAMIMVKAMKGKGWLRPERQLYRFKQQLEQVPAAELPSDPKFNPLRINPFVLFKAMPQSSNYAMKELIAAMEILYLANLKLISSKPPGQVLQQCLVSIIGTHQASSGQKRK
jgi:DNA polymerase III subunit delta